MTFGVHDPMTGEYREYNNSVLVGNFAKIDPDGNVMDLYPDRLQDSYPEILNLNRLEPGHAGVGVDTIGEVLEGVLEKAAVIREEDGDIYARVLNGEARAQYNGRREPVEDEKMLRNGETIALGDGMREGLHTRGYPLQVFRIE